MSLRRDLLRMVVWRIELVADWHFGRCLCLWFLSGARIVGCAVGDHSISRCSSVRVFWGGYETYICVRQRGKAYTVTVFDDRLARTGKVDIHVLAFVHAKLSTRYDYYTILNSCDMCGATDDAADEEATSDVLDGQAGKRGSALRGQNGDVDHASSQRGERTWFRSVRSG